MHQNLLQLVALATLRSSACKSCQSIHVGEGDSGQTECLSWCRAGSAGWQCTWCHCRGCEFCSPPPQPPPLPPPPPRPFVCADSQASSSFEYLNLDRLPPRVSTDTLGCCWQCAHDPHCKAWLHTLDKQSCCLALLLASSTRPKYSSDDVLWEIMRYFG